MGTVVPAKNILSVQRSLLDREDDIGNLLADWLGKRCNQLGILVAKPEAKQLLQLRDELRNITVAAAGATAEMENLVRSL